MLAGLLELRLKIGDRLLPLGQPLLGELPLLGMTALRILPLCLVAARVGLDLLAQLGLGLPGGDEPLLEVRARLTLVLELGAQGRDHALGLGGLLRAAAVLVGQLGTQLVLGLHRGLEALLELRAVLALALVLLVRLGEGAERLRRTRLGLRALLLPRLLALVDERLELAHLRAIRRGLDDLGLHSFLLDLNGFRLRLRLRLGLLLHDRLRRMRGSLNGLRHGERDHLARLRAGQLGLELDAGLRQSALDLFGRPRRDRAVAEVTQQRAHRLADRRASCLERLPNFHGRLTLGLPLPEFHPSPLLSLACSPTNIKRPSANPQALENRNFRDLRRH